MNIVITGSLGNIGKPLAGILVKEGYSVTVVSSKEEKREAIEALGASAAIGSVEDAGFLTDTFKGADAVFTMVPPAFGEADQMAYYKRLGANYAKAIEAAGVKRVVNLSSYGAHLDRGTGFILGAHHTESILNDLPEDVAVTQLRPGYFYYNLYAFMGMLKTAGIIGANYGGDDKLLLVAPADIAEAVAAELTAAEKGRKVRYVVSDEKTANEVAAAIGEAIGKPGLQWFTFTDAQAQQGMEEAGVPPYLATMFTELGASLHSGRLGEDYERNKPAERGKVKLEDFMQEFAAAYRSAEKAPGHGA